MKTLSNLLSLVAVAVILLHTFVFAAPELPGSITGTVIDQSTGERLIGISIVVVGTTRGAATDLDGNYIIKGLPVGTHSIRVSAVGYQTKIITGVNVQAAKPAELQIALTQESFNLKEVVITADEIHSTESAILVQRKNAVAISDGISSEQIKRTPDATSGDALKRVTGLSVVDNKFVFIRGVTDRYNGTMVDGAAVTSTEVGKRSFSYDLVPANLIENVSVIKSATPDLPGDFSGGLVQLNTLDFPSKRAVKLSIGQSYNDITTSRDMLLPYRSSSDWLGTDDGIRKFPGDRADQNDIARSAANTWAPKLRNAPYNTSFSLAYGDRFELGDEEATTNQLGFIGAFSYKNSYQTNDLYIHDIDLSRTNRGARSQYSALWGLLANLSYKFSGMHKLSIKNNFDRSGENNLARYYSDDYNLNSYNQYTLMRWTQRSTYTGQVIGEHTFPVLHQATLQWRASVSSSRRDDPDSKDATYYRSLDDPSQPLGVSANHRFWSFLNQRSYIFSSDVSVPLAQSKIKFGAYYDTKNESYRLRSFEIIPQYGISDSLMQLPLEVIYSPENFGPGKFKFHETSPSTDSYLAAQNVFAGYAMLDAPFGIGLQKFRFVGGARIENANQHVVWPGIDFPGAKFSSTDKHNADLLPSLNLTYLASEKINVRFAYSHSVNRPELRELAATQWYDILHYLYEGGNPNLRRAYVRNYDGRIEFFPNIGELVALSYFTKQISSAIEQRYLPGSTLVKSYDNVDRASNHGWELECKKGLDFLGGYAANFSLNGNYSRIVSTVDVKSIWKSDSVAYTRPMQGQSPYMMNISLLFTEPHAGTAINLLYNKFGRRIEVVGNRELNQREIYEEARETIDFSIDQPVRSWITAKLTIKNLTNKKRNLTQDGETYEQAGLGRTYALSVSLNY